VGNSGADENPKGEGDGENDDEEWGDFGDLL